MKECARKGCHATATVKPVLRLWADVDTYGPHEPIEAAVDLSLCAKCGRGFKRDKATIKDMVGKVNEINQTMGLAPIVRYVITLRAIE